MRDAEGEPLYYEGTVEDITQTLHANNLIALSERRFGALTEKAQMVTVLCDRFGKILFVSAAFERLLGYRTNVVEGANLFDFIHAADAYEQREELRRVAVGSNSGRESIMHFQHADGRMRYWAVIGNNCLEDEALNTIVLHLRDVTELLLADARVRHLASTDTLTAIANRACLEEATAAAITAAKNADGKVALVFLHINHFKVINDAYGHAFGDKLLQHIAALLKQTCGDDTLVARVGGDEFAVLVRTLASPAALALLCQKILKALAQTTRIDGCDVCANASASASIYPDDASSPAELLQQAELATFSAKANGRNTYRHFSPALAQHA